MPGGSKFSGEVPKGDGWGVESVVADMVQRVLNGEKSPLVPVVGIIDIKGLQIDPETHNVTAVVRVRRLEALDTIERIRAAQKMLLEQSAARRGEGTILPFEDRQLIEMAFGGLNINEIEQDEKETLADEKMSEFDRLRKHLVTVHQWAADDIRLEDMADHDIRAEHDRDHEQGSASGLPGHPADWWGWRRVDIEAAEAEADGETADGGVTEFDDGRQGLMFSDPETPDDE